MTTRFRTFVMGGEADPDAPVGSRPWCLWLDGEIRTALDRKQLLDSRVKGYAEAFKESQAYQTLGYGTWDEYCQRRLHRRAPDVDRQLMLRPVGRPSGENGNGSDYNHLDIGRGADYLRARMARDCPEQLERLARGEFRSVRAAAIDAGIVKDVKRYSVPDEPEAAARYLLERVDAEWLAAFLEALQ